ncbi:hypothetical protein [uncultured Rubinisphaera sp.]|uniref:hypothetical protein n=1 Tax=uncultured Rubinisphaera sp. TaxID=1678686 RepID=UPI000EE28F8C|nr:hypothetical protein [Planctomycetaceae bacterium]|tara:strand:- start:252 stop:551 length:300 start_codon:yes stop_codon:yes gene_type:complete
MDAGINSSRITPQFNIALFAFSAALGILNYLLSGNASGFPASSVVLSIGLDALRFILVAGITAYFIKEVWRRIVSNLWSVRPLSYQEAIAVVLTVGILF